tara:strand:- start:2568 stop:6248 length:3681 start_codon:yes stop_codon:yes gene_type:complete
MSVSFKSFDEFRPLNLNLSDNNMSLKNHSIRTAQGMSYNDYNFLDQVNDFKVKNFTNNMLTDEKEINQIIKFKSLSDLLAYPLDINSKLAFSGTSTASATNFLTFDPNNSKTDSDVSLLADGNQNNVFILDFVDQSRVMVKTKDGPFIKYLSLPGLTEDQILKFRVIDPTAVAQYKYIFNYTLDNTKQFLTLSQDIGFNSVMFAPFSSVASTSGVSESIFLSAVPVTTYTDDSRNFNSIASQRGIIKVSLTPEIIDTNNLNNYNLYDFNNDHIISSESLSGRKNNFLSYFPYEVTSLSTVGAGNIPYYTNNLNFFNLKNQISNKNNVNSLLPFENKTAQKRYTGILNETNKETENENLLLGYNFYTKEYKIKPDKNTKFTLPDDIYPYQKLNINDSSLIDNGAYSAKSPYFSDKVFKLLDSNKNVNTDVQDFNQLFILQDGSSFLQDEQTNNILIKQEFGNKTENDNTGRFLCSWLSGDSTTGKWYDRYYYPQNNTFTEAFSGTTDQVFEYESQASKYFKRFGIKETFYDIESNLTFQPQGTYFYGRVGNKYINKVINNFKGNLIKDSFNTTFSGKVLDNQNKLNFSEYAYDKLNFDTLNSNNFSINFDMNQNSLSSIDSYQILGNNYRDGFALLNNFYFTPFIIMHKENRVFVYDKDFNKLKENTYSDLSAINDIVYLEQNNDLVLIGDNQIIRTTIDGEILDSKSTGIGNLNKLYQSRAIFGYNKAIFLNNTPSFDPSTTANPADLSTTLLEDNFHLLQLNNLSVSSTEVQSYSGKNSLITTEDGSIYGLEGFKGKNLDNSVGVSISGIPFAGNVGSFVMFENLSAGSTKFSNPLSTNKTIYDINVKDELLYVQSYDSNQGYINIFDKQRKLQRTLYLNTSAASGYKLDFINEKNNIKLLSFSKLSNDKFIVDKFDLETTTLSSLSTTYELNETFDEMVLGGKSRFQSPTNFNFIETKYKRKQGKLHFRFNLNNFVTSNFVSVLWNIAGPTTFTKFLWNEGGQGSGGTADNLSAWDGKFNTLDAGASKTDVELILPINNLQQRNNMNFNFNLINGKIDLHLNGRLNGSIEFAPNKFPVDSLLYPELFFNTKNIKNKSISEITGNNDFYGSGGVIENLKIYNKSLADDYIKYLYLKNKKIDNLIFDIPCGMRNNVEEINNLYNYNIPGRKNNNLKIYIKNGAFDIQTQENITNFIDKKIGNVLPANVENIEYDFSINKGPRLIDE